MRWTPTICASWGSWTEEDCLPWNSASIFARTLSSTRFSYTRLFSITARFEVEEVPKTPSQHFGLIKQTTKVMTSASPNHIGPLLERSSVFQHPGRKSTLILCPIGKLEEATIWSILINLIPRGPSFRSVSLVHK